MVGKFGPGARLARAPAPLPDKALKVCWHVPTTGQALCSTVVPFRPSSASPVSQADTTEADSLRRLLLVGSVLVAMLCGIEWSAGVINPWDRWLQPAMALLFMACGLGLRRWPRWAGLLRLAAVVGFNAYLTATLLVVMLVLPPPLNHYQLLTTVYWLPLGYGTAFVFLRTRQAVAVSAVMLAMLVLPIGGTALRGGTAHWGPDTGALLGVIGIGQLAYIKLLHAIATLRAGYRRSERQAHAMRALAHSDELTGLPNRRALLDRLQATVLEAERHGGHATLALIDVDHFKRINDRFGHAAGDEVLARLAKLLAAGLRQTDCVGRWGGEEFLLLCPATPPTAARDLADRLRDVVAACPFPHGERVTISIGLAAVRAGESADRVLARADAALYEAKARGRNRVEVACAETGREAATSRDRVPA